MTNNRSGSSSRLNLADLIFFCLTVKKRNVHSACNLCTCLLMQFAHRKCVQRWCNEKGDITCEICHQVCQCISFGLDLVWLWGCGYAYYLFYLPVTYCPLNNFLQQCPRHIPYVKTNPY